MMKFITKTHTFIEKSRARSSRCCGQPFVGQVGTVIKEMISIGTEVLFHLMLRC